MLGDFGTESFLRRGYHHLPENEVHTYKQKYQDIFTATGTYREIAKIVYNHDTREISTDIDNDNMATISILKKQDIYTDS